MPIQKGQVTINPTTGEATGSGSAKIIFDALDSTFDYQDQAGAKLAKSRQQIADISNAMSTTTDPIIFVEDEKPQGTSGGTPPASYSYQDRDLNQMRINTIPGAFLNSNLVTLPIGNYVIRAASPCLGVANKEPNHHLAWSKTDNTVLVVGPGNRVYHGNINTAFLRGYFVLSAQTSCKLRHYIDDGTDMFGVPSNIPGQPEVYSSVFLKKVQ